MEQTLEQLLEIHLIQIWNQRDVELRTKAMENVYTKDIAMYNSDEILTGYEAINHKADVVLNRFPPNFSIYQLKANIIHNNVGKLEWGVGANDAAPVLTGTDIIFFEDGKIKSFYVFINK